MERNEEFDFLVIFEDFLETFLRIFGEFLREFGEIGSLLEEED